MIKKTLLLVTIIIGISHSYAQEIDWEAEFNKLEAEIDSISIFYLLDSVLKNNPLKYSELDLGVSYNSNVLSAGRNYGINQRSISPGITYYHQSGLYGDYSGYIDTDTTFDYSLSILTLGYLIGKKKWSIVPSYERWIYHNGNSNLNNSLGTTFSYTGKYGYASLDYSFLFGNETAHRIIGSISGTINLGKFWKFTKVRILPTSTVFFGNTEVLNRFEGNLLEEAKTNEQLRAILFSEDFRVFAQSAVTVEEQQLIDAINEQYLIDNRDHRDRPNDRDRIERINALYNVYNQNESIRDYISILLYNTSDAYGIMNYSFTIPILLQTKHISTILSYSYSYPVQLPGEIISLDPTSYFGISLLYRIPLNIK